nr:ice-structuring protein-like [Setaria viridis]
MPGCYVGKATKIFLALLGLLAVVGVVLAFRTVLHRSARSSPSSATGTPCAAADECQPVLPGPALAQPATAAPAAVADAGAPSAAPAASSSRATAAGISVASASSRDRVAPTGISDTAASRRPAAAATGVAVAYAAGCPGGAQPDGVLMPLILDWLGLRAG